MFQGKVVLITGSSVGIGAGTAVQFAREAASGVVIHGRNEEELKKVKSKCEEAGKGKTKVLICLGDITSDEVRAKLINDTIMEFGRLDVLVNNAGFAIRGTGSEGTIDSYDKIFAVNVRAVVALTQLAIPHLIKIGGNIINVSSVAAVKAFSASTFYCMSKAALDHFSRCLAVELGPKGVRVNSVNPGYIHDTEFQSRMGIAPEQSKQFAEARANIYPLRRVGTVEEVADQIIHLASDKAKFITGITLPIEGGGLLA